MDATEAGEIAAEATGPRLPALFRRARAGGLERLQLAIGVLASPELPIRLRELIVRLRIVGIEGDGLLKPLHAEVTSTEQRERLPGEKEVAPLPRVALCGFRGEIEGALCIPELDQELGEVRIDDVVGGMVLVDERERLEIVLLRLANVAERLRGEAKVVPRLVGERIER